MSEKSSHESFDNKKWKAARPAHYVSAIAAGVSAIGASIPPAEAEAPTQPDKTIERNDAIGALISKLEAIQARHEQIITPSEYSCIVENIYHEARGENDREKMRIALVTLSRAIDERGQYPDTPCGVVYDAKQFSWTLSKDLRSAKKNEAQMRKISDLIHGLVHGHTASVAVTLLSMSLQMHERPLFYKRTDDRGVSERSKAFFKLLVPIAIDPTEQPGAHTFYRLPTPEEIAARAKR